MEEWVRAEQEKERDEWELYRTVKFFVDRYGLLSYHSVLVEVLDDLEKQKWDDA